MGDDRTTFIVREGESVSNFLFRIAGYPQFKIPVLLECGGVVVRRDGHEIELKQKHDRVEPGDIVSIRKWKCLGKLDQFPPEQYRDYAFVPEAKKGDEYLPGMRETLSLRPQTVILDNRQNLQSFLDLKRSDIDHPVRDLLIVSHANAQGLLELPLDVSAPQQVVYEDLQGLADAGSLKVNLDFARPRPKDATGRELPFTIRFRGCQIGAIPRYLEGKPGAAPPVLALFKRATGARVNAPKYFHGTGANPRQRGRFEYLTYSFTLYTKESLSDLTAVAEAFRSADGFSFFDGSPVPAGQWAKWLKAKEEKKQRQRLPDPEKKDRKIALQSVRLKSPTDLKDLPTTTDLWYFKEEPFSRVQTVKLAAEPATDHEKREAVAKALRERDDFKDSHPYPWWGRLGYRSLNEFVADLLIDWDAEGGVLTYFLERNQYILRIPISRPKDQVLLANFYPAKPADPVILLAEEDERFFTTV